MATFLASDLPAIDLIGASDPRGPSARLRIGREGRARFARSPAATASRARRESVPVVGDIPMTPGVSAPAAIVRLVTGPAAHAPSKTVPGATGHAAANRREIVPSEANPAAESPSAASHPAENPVEVAANPAAVAQDPAGVPQAASLGQEGRTDAHRRGRISRPDAGRTEIQ